MTIIESIVLGIIQGLTEFLPISSTGHLTLAGKLMGLIDEANPEHWTAFIAVIQLGTMVSILAYFWKDILNISIAFIKDNLISRKNLKEQSSDSKLGWYIILGSIPVVIVGLGFKDVIEGALTKNLYVIAGSLIILAIILAIAEKTGKFKKNISDMNWKDALLIGLGQSLALIPGSSRSGTTITASIFLGYARESAARFSFLLSIPAIFGSGLLQLKEALEYMTADMALTLTIATVVSGISGYLAIEFLLKYLKNHTTFIFVYYRVIVGLLILLFIGMKMITA